MYKWQPSQCFPVNLGMHSHLTDWLSSELKHVPPFRHGFGLQIFSSATNMKHRSQCFWGSFEGVRDFKFPWCGGLLHVSRRLFWRYWPSITLNFDTVIKRNCLIQFLQNLMALDGSLNVIQNGQTKFCCLVHGKYTPLIENSYLVISGLLLFYKFNFSAFGLQVSRRSCG